MVKGIRYFWRLWYRLRFHLFQRHRFNRLVLEKVAGRPFIILPSVFNPALFFTSEFMVSAFNDQLIPAGSTVLDMGTGSGVGAIFAAQWAGRVVGVDLNPSAVRCAHINVLLNQVEEKVDIYQGDLFAPVQQDRFDVVIFNPPYYQGEPTSMLDCAFHASDVMERFVAKLADHLTPTGHVLLKLSTAGDEANFLKLFQSAGYQITIVQQKALPLERLTLYLLIPQPDAILTGS